MAAEAVVQVQRRKERAPAALVAVLETLAGPRGLVLEPVREAPRRLRVRESIRDHLVLIGARPSTASRLCRSAASGAHGSFESAWVVCVAPRLQRDVARRDLRRPLGRCRIPFRRHRPQPKQWPQRRAEARPSMQARNGRSTSPHVQPFGAIEPRSSRETFILSRKERTRGWMSFESNAPLVDRDHPPRAPKPTRLFEPLRRSSTRRPALLARACSSVDTAS